MRYATAAVPAAMAFVLAGCGGGNGGETLTPAVSATAPAHGVVAVPATAAPTTVSASPAARRAVAETPARARSADVTVWVPRPSGVATASTREAIPAPVVPVVEPVVPVVEPVEPLEQAVEPVESAEPGEPAEPVEHYASCAAAEAAGAAPLHVGDPGYREGLDRDGDGVACES